MKGAESDEHALLFDPRNADDQEEKERDAQIIVFRRCRRSDLDAALPAAARKVRAEERPRFGVGLILRTGVRATVGLLSLGPLAEAAADSAAAASGQGAGRPTQIYQHCSFGAEGCGCAAAGADQLHRPTRRRSPRYPWIARTDGRTDGRTTHSGVRTHNSRSGGRWQLVYRAPRRPLPYRPKCSAVLQSIYSVHLRSAAARARVL